MWGMHPALFIVGFLPLMIEGLGQMTYGPGYGGPSSISSTGSSGQGSSSGNGAGSGTSGIGKSMIGYGPLPGMTPMTPAGPMTPGRPGATPGRIPGRVPPSKIIIPPNVPYQCTLRVDSGYFCGSGYPRPSVQYYYDPYSQRCHAFSYLGCGGTANRYYSRSECLRRCGCNSNLDYGYPCPYPPTRRYAYNKYSGTCFPFYFSSCNGGNDNNFRSELECSATCAPGGCVGPFCGRMAPGMSVASGTAGGGSSSITGGTSSAPAIGNGGAASAFMKLAMPGRSMAHSTQSVGKTGGDTSGIGMSSMMGTSGIGMSSMMGTSGIDMSSIMGYGPVPGPMKPGRRVY